VLKNLILTNTSFVLAYYFWVKILLLTYVFHWTTAFAWTCHQWLSILFTSVPLMTSISFHKVHVHVCMPPLTDTSLNGFPQMAHTSYFVYACIRWSTLLLTESATSNLFVFWLRTPLVTFNFFTALVIYNQSWTEQVLYDFRKHLLCIMQDAHYLS